MNAWLFSPLPLAEGAGVRVRACRGASLRPDAHPHSSPSGRGALYGEVVA